MCLCSVKGRNLNSEVLFYLENRSTSIYFLDILSVYLVYTLDFVVLKVVIATFASSI